MSRVPVVGVVEGFGVVTGVLGFASGGFGISAFSFMGGHSICALGVLIKALRLRRTLPCSV